MRKCTICGNPLPKFRRKYCSIECEAIGIAKQKERYKEQKQAQNPPQKTFCKICGIPTPGYPFCTACHKKRREQLENK